MAVLFENLDVTQRRKHHRFGGVAERFLEIGRERAHVHADANRDLARFCRGHDFGDLLRIADVARIQAQFRDAGFDRRQRHLMIEVDVGDDRYRRARDDRRQARGIGRILYGDAHDLAAFHREAVDLLERLVGVGGIGRRHRLHDDRMIAADPHAFRIGFAGLVLQKDRIALATQAQHELHYSLSRDDARDVVEGHEQISAISAAKPAR